MVDFATLIWFVLVGVLVGLVHSWTIGRDNLSKTASLTVGILAAVCGGVFFSAFGLGAPIGMALISALIVLLAVHVFVNFF